MKGIIGSRRARRDNRGRAREKSTFDINWSYIPTSFHHSSKEDGDVSDFAFLENSVILSPLNQF
jgi:hypothetical protein